jgi:hypothetical protein
MRRGLIAVLASLGALATVPAALAAQPSSGVRGSVLDTTCIAGCEVECPPPPTCTPQACTGVGHRFVCPLSSHRPPKRATVPEVCTQAGCPGPPVVKYPPYEGTAATVILRKAGSAKVLGRLPVVAGKFTAHVPPGRYVLRAHVSESCWTGTKQVVEVIAGRFIPVVLKVADGCVMHPDS